MTGSALAGIGAASPRGELTNAELSARLGVSESWIGSRTGIVSRRIASELESASSLGTAAGLAAIADAGARVDEIDLVVCATVTPDFRFPSTACQIQAALGIAAPAFDLNAGCSGFLFALAQADAAIRSGMASTVLVVGAEVLSRITDYTDPKTSILFGDGAGAVVVQRSEEPRVGPFELFADGSRPELLYVDVSSGLIRMEGREVYRAAVEAMSGSVAGLLGAHGLGPDDVGLVVAHQANQRILDAVASRLALDPDKVFSNVARHGNTSGASIPLALFDARAEGRLRAGDVVVLTAFGAGFTWGAGLLRWGTTTDRSRRVGRKETADA